MRLDELFEDPVAWDEARVATSAWGCVYIACVSEGDYEVGIRNPQNTQWLCVAYHLKSRREAHDWGLRNLFEIGHPK